MAGDNDKDKGGGGTIDVAALTRDITKGVMDSLKPTLDAVGELKVNQKILADTIAADAKPKAGDKSDPAAGDAEKPLTRAEMERLADERADAKLKARDDAEAAKATRQATVDRLVKEKLGGKADLAPLLTGADDDALGKQADALASQLNIKPGFGGAAKDGGTVPGTNAAGNAATGTVRAIGNLTDGQAKFAAGLKGEIPGA